MKVWYLILLLMTGPAVMAQNYLRHVPAAAKRTQTRAVQPTIQYDTITAPPADSIALSGFEKPLRSVRESLFVTNHTCRPLTGVILEVSYFDMHGNLLHRATREASVTLPAGETRRIELPSFDRQQLFYYHQSPLPRGAVQATPFDVKVRVVNSIHPQTSQQ